MLEDVMLEHVMMFVISFTVRLTVMAVVPRC